MEQKEIIELIHSRGEELLQRDKSGKGFICPICNSGTGKNGTGLSTRDHIKYTCWRGCFSSADIIDIIGLRDNITEKREQIRHTAELLGIDIRKPLTTSIKKPVREATYQEYNNNKTSGETEQEPDYTSFFQEANKHLQETDYHRGLSLETLNRYSVGYVKDWRNPKNPNGKASPRLIIPTSNSSYIARHTASNNDSDRIRKVGKTHSFNIKALDGQEPVFITEGEIDALSIIDAGGLAVGIGGTSGVRMLLQSIQGKKELPPLIIALDNDEAGENASRELIEGLGGFLYVVANKTLYQGKKDANEALNANREGFIEAVHQEIEKAKEKQDELRQVLIAELERESVAYSLQDFLDRVTQEKKGALPTGFNRLDKIIDGGLYPGLYLVGAISGLGKTSFALQIADNIATLQERDVLYIALEMAKDELIAKSLSRLTYQYCEGNIRNAKTTRGILDGSKYSSFNPQEQELIKRAINTYEAIARHIYIKESVGETTTDDIRAELEKHYRIKGKAPVVIVDYLQILGPLDTKATDKQNIDRAVTALKRMSRDFDTPVFVISSFNRANYKNNDAPESFKDSGNIEYSADVLMSMSYDEYAMEQTGEKLFKNQVKKLKDIKAGESYPIHIGVIKNRNGITGELNLNFLPHFNIYEEDEISELLGDALL